MPTCPNGCRCGPDRLRFGDDHHAPEVMAPRATKATSAADSELSGQELAGK
ncbi:hypothetical protein ACFFX0_12480 [Citricoccus parietis]|uniref:Uncharacterized protein n=1 Tax=Citricoccus parietis TaxID=592307 RepID=A0ABV5FZ58_9MICC